MTAISRNMPLASLHSAFEERKGGGETEKQRGKLLEKRATIALPLEGADGGMDGGCRTLHDGAEFTAKEGKTNLSSAFS